MQRYGHPDNWYILPGYGTQFHCDFSGCTRSMLFHYDMNPCHDRIFGIRNSGADLVWTNPLQCWDIQFSYSWGGTSVSNVRMCVPRFMDLSFLITILWMFDTPWDFSSCAISSKSLVRITPLLALRMWWGEALMVTPTSVLAQSRLSAFCKNMARTQFLHIPDRASNPHDAFVNGKREELCNWFVGHTRFNHYESRPLSIRFQIEILVSSSVFFFRLTVYLLAIVLVFLICCHHSPPTMQP